MDGNEVNDPHATMHEPIAPMLPKSDLVIGICQP